MSLHSIRHTLSAINNELNTIELTQNIDKLNNDLYDAAICAEKELQFLFKLTGHGCTETMARLRSAIDNATLVNNYVSN